MAMVVVAFLLSLFLVTGVVWSQDPDGLVFCYTDGDCNTLTAESQLTRRQCCVDTSEAVGFQVEGDETCNICIVFGFTQPTFSGPERGEQYSLDVGYLKGREEAGQNLIFTVNITDATTTPNDFTLNDGDVRVFSAIPDLESVSFTFRVDAIAQEPDETLTLRLVPRPENFNYNNNAFFLDEAFIQIIDSDEVEVIFTEEDFRSLEDEGSVPVLVNKNNRIATPIVVEVSPVTLTQHRATGRPDPPGVEPDNPFSPIEAILDDFDNTVIVLTFQPDEVGTQVNDLDAAVPIVDDEIDEANEQDFVVSLRILNVTNPNGITVSRRDAVCRIIDDDAIQVGLEEMVYSTPEGDVVVEVCTVVISGTLERNTFVTLQSEDGTANAGADYSSLSADPTFTPTTNRICQNISILDDVIYENDETIRVFLETDDPDVIIVPDRSEGEITIVDNDVLVVGWVQELYEVNEGDGSATMCATVREGNLATTLPGILVDFRDGSADSPADYIRLADFPFVFSASAPGPLCVSLPIIDDDAVELPEDFLGDLSWFADVPDRVTIDPVTTRVVISDANESSVSTVTSETTTTTTQAPETTQLEQTTNQDTSTTSTSSGLTTGAIAGISVAAIILALILIAIIVVVDIMVERSQNSRPVNENVNQRTSEFSMDTNLAYQESTVHSHPDDMEHSYEPVY